MALGLIPARAGGLVEEIDDDLEGAHPRAGGRASSRRHTPRAYEGSSPRGRADGGDWDACIAGGLIPARAGGLAVSRVGRVVGGLIPARAGGPATGVAAPAREGSSPRGRGGRSSQWSSHCRRAHPRAGGADQVCIPETARAWRLIPARAGRTLPDRSRWGGQRAHPARAGRTTGGSRLARGSGLIPARAGGLPCAIGHAAPDRLIPRGRADPSMALPMTRSGLIPARAGRT